MYPDDDTPIERLMNLGPASARWLHPVGIRTLGDLKTRPLDVLYGQVKRRIPRCNAVFLYAVFGALANCHWNTLPPDIKRRLRDVARTANAAIKKERAAAKPRHSLREKA